MPMETKKQNAPLKILLADDDKDDRFFFEKALKEIPISTQLKTVEDGEKLMDYLTGNLEDLPYVLFLDLNMPRKKGSECLTEMKQNPKLKEIPVIIYSTSLHEEIANELYQNGAHYYLQKCDFTELPKLIEKVLTLLLGNPEQPSIDKFIVSMKDVQLS